jgi:hypothetical protein
MYNYIYKHQLVDKYFSGYTNYNTNNYSFNEGFTSFTRFKNLDSENCNNYNTDEYICDFEMDEQSNDNGTYNLSTNFFSKNK